MGISQQEEDDKQAGWDELKWNDVFSGFPAQAEFTVVTNLIIGKGKEAYVKFGGYTLRWINPEQGLSAVIVIPISGREDYKQEFELVLTFLSRLSFETGQGAFVSTSTTYMRRINPFLLPAKTLFVRYPDHWRPQDGSLSANLDLAMAFYREGINTINESPFYAFLSFYKVIQLAFKEDPTDISNWINRSLASIFTTEKAAQIQTDKQDVAKDLWKSGRCAVTHTKTKPVANPNNVDDLQRIRSDMWIAQELAKWAIKTQAGSLKSASEEKN